MMPLKLPSHLTTPSDSSSPEGGKATSNVFRWVAMLLLGVAFVIDTLVPFGYALWVLYLIGTFISIWTTRKTIIVVTVSACLLIVLGALLSPGGDLITGLVNRALGITVISSCGAICLRQIQMAERIHAENALRNESELMVRSFFQEVPYGILAVNPQGVIVQTNVACNELFGYEGDELLGVDVERLVPERLRESHSELRQAFFRHPISRIMGVDREVVALRKDGTEFFAEVRLTSVAAEDADLVVASVVNVTSRKEYENRLKEQAEILRQQRLAALSIAEDARLASARARASEEALSRSEERHRALVETITAVFWTTDPQGHFVTPQHGWEAFTGQSWEQYRGVGWLDAVHPDDRQSLMDRWQRAVEEKTNYRAEGRLWNASSQTHHHFEVFAVSLLDVNEEVREWVGAVIDIDERIHTLEALRESQESLKATAKELRLQMAETARSNQDLEQFAYVASHDLQEPLRAVTGYCQLLEMDYKDQLDDQATEYVQNVLDGAKRMRTLIQDLLAYSRVGRKGSEFQPTDCNTAVQSALRNLETMIEETGSKIHVDELPVVQADGQQFVQLFQNLIGNAIKYKSQSAPEVYLEAKQTGSDWVFSVRDNGIGIAPEFRERIFILFQRLHTRNEYEGTGIGLAICKRIIDRHQGKIWVEPTAEGGSIFSFTIPVGDVPSRANLRPSERVLDGLQ